MTDLTDRAAHIAAHLAFIVIAVWLAIGIWFHGNGTALLGQRSPNLAGIKEVLLEGGDNNA